MSTEINTVVDQLFRQESGKLASSLSRAFGLSQLGVVEDIVQDTLLAALQNWSFRGVPENPTAWLHRVAKNKAVDWIRTRQRDPQVWDESIPGLAAATHSMEIEQHFLSWEIADSQLRMMFACCHPGISEESQIALVLKTLCGFSVREIANAFLTNEASIEKRLGRARKYFREHRVELEVPSRQAVHDRTGTVLRSLYLLFNEGYKRTDSEGLLNRDLCLEALRLALLLADHAEVGTPESMALVSLMSFHAARFDARTDVSGEIILLSEQDRSQWNPRLIDNGVRYLERSRPDINISTYHLEAAIQSLHCTAATFEQTNWAAILGLYKRLNTLSPSPVTTLHMAVPVCRVHGPTTAIELLRSAPLTEYYLYHSVLGHCFEQAGIVSEAIASYEAALRLTKNEREKHLLLARIDVLRANGGSKMR